MTEEKRANRTIHLAGLEAAVGRATKEHKGARRVAGVTGMNRVSLAKLVAIADVFRDPKTQYEVLWLVVPR